MTSPSTTPRGERASRPGARWETVLRSLGEHVVQDRPLPDTAGPDMNQPQEPRANRATRRAARQKRAT